MTSQGITCVAGGSLTAGPAGLALVEHAICRTTAAAPPGRAWCIETAAPGWFVFRRRQDSQVLTVSGRNDTEVILAATAPGTRHHWRIIPYPERGNVVIISRVTGLALTAGTPAEGRPSPVGLTAYHGAATQHWSFTDRKGASHAFQP
jgi:hypothetical protein